MPGREAVLFRALVAAIAVGAWTAFPAVGHADSIRDDIQVAGHDGNDDAGHGCRGSRHQLMVQRVDDLRFGSLVPHPRLSGTVSIDPATGARRVAGAVVDMGAEYGRAAFEVRGKPDCEFEISLPSRATVEGSFGRATLSDFVAMPQRFGRIEPNGRSTIYVGATLTFGPNQEPGPYGGGFDIAVEYR